MKNNLKRSACFLICFIIAVFSISVPVNAANYCMAYGPNGEMQCIYENETEYFESRGWRVEPYVKIYSGGGQVMETYKEDAEEKIKSGYWYDSPLVLIYSTTGECISVPESRLAEYKALGWSTTPFTTIYSPNGEQMQINSSELSTYTAYGWSQDIEAVKTTLYASDGRTIKVFNNQVSAYTAVGWSTIPSTGKLPVTFTEAGTTTKTMTLTDVEISNIRYFSHNGYVVDKNLICFDITILKDGNSIPIDIQCYDASNALISTVSYKYSSPIVPYNTAYIRLVPRATSTQSVVSGSYTYANPVTVYAMDGRSKTIFDLQVPYYRDNFWYEAETLYSLDGRTITIPPYEAEAYMAVGWYTYDGYQYAQMEQYVQRLFNSKAFADAYIYVTNCEASFKGTAYEYSAAVLKSKAMDEWRKYINCPIAYISNYVNNYYGAPSARITLRNLSYKEVEAIRIKFTCYNAFGEVIKTYNPYTFSNAQLSPGEERMYNLPFYGHDYAYSIGNVEIVEVAYTDGTKWKK